MDLRYMRHVAHAGRRAASRRRAAWFTGRRCPGWNRVVDSQPPRRCAMLRMVIALFLHCLCCAEDRVAITGFEVRNGSMIVQVEYRIDSVPSGDLLVGFDNEKVGRFTMGRATKRLLRGVGVAEISMRVPVWLHAGKKSVHVNISDAARDERKGWSPICNDVADVTAVITNGAAVEVNPGNRPNF
jgi:hypothetical protein